MFGFSHRHGLLGMGKLTEKQKKFCDLFIKLNNATQAAIQAGYSKKTARIIAQQNLTKLDIKKYIKKRVFRADKKRKVDAENVVQEIANVAFSDIGLVAEWNDEKGLRLIDSKELDENNRKAIQSIKTSPSEWGMSKQFKMQDKLKALELLAKHLGLLDGQGNTGISTKDSIDELSRVVKKRLGKDEKASDTD